MARSLIAAGQLDAMCETAGAVPPGAFIEVGVYRGGSAERLAKVAREHGRDLWLFDSFTGIVERTEGVDHHKVGDFSDTSVGEVRALIPEALIVVGDACETLPATDTGPLAFVHMDVDQYATHRACIAELQPRMVRGGVMWFDDADALAGAWKAVSEAFGDRLQQHDCGKWFVRF